MQVYLVSRSEYSDWSILGLFSTREKAQAFADEARKSMGTSVQDIEEYELDSEVDKVAGPLYAYQINLNGGRAWPMTSEPRSIRHPQQCEIVEGSGPEGPYIRVRSPISADHAMKVAVEKWQEWLRTRSAP